MVFFTCNACGQSVKKAQVEKHYMTQCRSCEVLSCMDCGKDFVGDAYKEHTQCVTEDQKYGGKDYKAPAKGNKGEAKQQQWLQRLQEAKESSKLSPAVANLLNKVAEYPNVPRKKSKFENFLYNSLRVTNKALVEQVWNVFNDASTAHYKEMTKAAEQKNNASKTDTPETADKSQDSETDQSDEPSESTDQSQNSKKKKKKGKSADVETETVESHVSKKDKKRKRQGDPEVDIAEEEELENVENVKKSKKKRKHQRDAEEEQSHISQEVNGKSKKKKRRRGFEEEKEAATDVSHKMDDDSTVDNGEAIINTKKFKWEKVILAILQTCPEQQLPIKKLKKKVLNEYHSCGGDVRIKSDQQLRATFEKKVMKNPNIKVHKEVVRLVS